ncbi:hypothetical protein N1851_013336 [Merluccius polli]|uniref:Uncharacterized protein n=1 Tax=Merluccius polli TaxID=89951 RepID=A0AA47P1R7_MERPO|nr:hypothetical protein N1851_013336 [Merluccius polli]
MKVEAEAGRQGRWIAGDSEDENRSQEFSELKPYYDQLTALVAAFSKQVAVIQGGAEQAPAPKDTEWVLLKVIKWKWSEPRWTGPYRVTERTSHAVRLDGKGDTWYHWSICRASDPPAGTRGDVKWSVREQP